MKTVACAMKTKACEKKTVACAMKTVANAMKTATCAGCPRNYGRCHRNYGRCHRNYAGKRAFTCATGFAVRGTSGRKGRHDVILLMISRQPPREHEKLQLPQYAGAVPCQNRTFQKGFLYMVGKAIAKSPAFLVCHFLPFVSISRSPSTWPKRPDFLAFGALPTSQESASIASVFAKSRQNFRHWHPAALLTRGQRPFIEPLVE